MGSVLHFSIPSIFFRYFTTYPIQFPLLVLILMITATVHDIDYYKDLLVTFTPSDADASSTDTVTPLFRDCEYSLVPRDHAGISARPWARFLYVYLPPIHGSYTPFHPRLFTCTNLRTKEKTFGLEEVPVVTHPGTTIGTQENLGSSSYVYTLDYFHYGRGNIIGGPCTTPSPQAHFDWPRHGRPIRFRVDYYWQIIPTKGVRDPVSKAPRA
ncbi:hypothetical protein BDZ94DRAFT_1241189 [Collybia nuda]|uniref:Uncharacterized protein n=1 Tax=Collybia nuda TaxID=64659 RepID=A0A9P5XSF7_9AGAR|nr:hypothetical protein BDZ94DRAFT_1241189 [Collybia nuda]